MAGNSNSGRDNKSSGNRGSKSGSSGSKSNTSNRGFASMDEDKQREIAKKGGAASHGGGRSNDR